jgi:hypothetical protein
MSAPAQSSVLPPEWERRVRDELEPGERLVWTGLPRADRVTRSALGDWPVTVFGLIWVAAVIGAFVFFMDRRERQREETRRQAEEQRKFQEDNFGDDFFAESRRKQARMEQERQEQEAREQEWTHPMTFVPVLVLVVFVLFGLWFAATPLRTWLRGRKDQRLTCYALTDRRAGVGAGRQRQSSVFVWAKRSGRHQPD